MLSSSSSTSSSSLPLPLPPLPTPSPYPKQHQHPPIASHIVLDASPEPSLTPSERGVSFSVGPSFYRPQSSLGRDLAVLAAALYRRSNGQLRVLDAMSGCGVRALRYLCQSQADFVLANDWNDRLHDTIVQNLSRHSPPPGEHYALDFANSCLQNGASFSEGSNPDASSMQEGRKYNIRTGICNDGRYNLERNASLDLFAKTSHIKKETHLFSNDLNASRASNVADAKWMVCHDEVTKLLLKCHLSTNYFDFIDIDSFGRDSLFIGPALSAIRYGGLLYLTCTDGSSSGGRRPQNSLASYGAFIKRMPYGNELGLRMLIGAVVKEAAPRKMIVSPVFSVYAPHGPVFRVLLRISRGKSEKIKNYQFICYCGKCGDSRTVDWKILGTTSCPCSDKVSDSIKMSGPLWTGPLHNAEDILAMIALATEWGWIPENADNYKPGKGSKLKADKLQVLLNLMLEESQPELPFGYIHLDEVGKRGRIHTPARGVLLQALRDEGYIVSRSQIAPNVIKTNCSMTCCIALAQRLAESNDNSKHR